MIKAIIFDAFGTLISTGSGSLDATKQLLRIKNYPNIDAKAFYSKWKAYHTDILLSSESFVREETAFRIALEKLYCEYAVVGNGYTDADLLINTFDKRELFPEVLKTVECLKKDYLLCIGSNTDDYPLYRNMEKNGLSIEKVFTSEALKVYKPQKEFYISILNELGLSCDEVLFVGDSLVDDVFGPSKFGMKTCHVNRKNITYTDIVPDISVSSLEQIADVIKTLTKTDSDSIMRKIIF